MSADDRTLVARCLEGDDRAFDMLLERYERQVFNGALRMVSSRDDAEDITQNVFLKVYRSLGRFDARYKFFSWIYRITVNESINFLNRKRPLDPVDERTPSPLRGPLDSLHGTELSDAVQEALMQLKPLYRAVIVLRHFHGCSYREMSEILEIKEDTVKSRLFTGRRDLRDLMVRKGDSLVVSTERYIELIHGEIDGENTPEQSAELKRILQDQDAAREFQEDLKRLAGVLGRVEEEDVPPGLRDAIHAQLDTERTAAPVKIQPRPAAAFGGWRIAAALAAGLVLGLIAGPFVLRGDTDWDANDVVGSMVPDPGHATSNTVRLGHGSASGSVSADRGGEQVLVSFEFSAADPVEIALVFDPSTIGFNAFARETGEFETASASAGRFTLTGSGELAGRLAFERLRDDETGLQIELRSEGAVLDSERLDLSRSER